MNHLLPIRLMLLLLALISAAVGQAKSDPFDSLYESRHAAASAALERAEGEVPGAQFDREPAPSELPVISKADVEQFARLYWGGRAASVQRALERVFELRSTIAPILREEGVPEALLAVVLVESAGRPDALSPKGARGLWQFMPDTARSYGLRVTDSEDERLHVGRATRAAARHLRDLFRTFGSWELALAAYNYGSGGLRRAISRGRTSDFQQLLAARLLPAETRAYVPAVNDAIELLQLSSLKSPAVTQSDKRLFAIAEAIPTNGVGSPREGDQP